MLRRLAALSALALLIASLSAVSPAVASRRSVPGVDVRLTNDDPALSGYVSGTILLDAPQLRDFARNGRSDVVRGVAEHELGHLVGLGHVNDQHQIMFPESDLQVSSYQDGDRRGLAQLGAGPCRPGL